MGPARKIGVKTFVQRLSFQRVIVVGLSGPILLFVIIGWLQWQANKDRQAAREWVVHSRDVQQGLEGFLSTMKDAETGQRGFLLTSQATYLDPYRNALVSAPHRLKALVALTADNPQQQQNLASLESLMQAKLDDLTATVSLAQQGDIAKALSVVNGNHGEGIMDEIRGGVLKCQQFEGELLQQREQEYQAQFILQTRLTILLIILGIAFGAIMFYLLNRLEKLQSVVKICAWSKLIEYEGDWLSIEDYLQRRYRVSITHGISETEADRFIRENEEQRGQGRKPAD
jgi:CHASE3 domain sensor protein